MVVGDRLSNGTYAKENRRAFHGFGNDLVRAMIKWIYGYEYADVMTGFRAMSKPFVKTFPVLSGGFQIETELSIHAVDRRWRIQSIPIDYRDRPEGSESKLNTLSDGIKVVAMVGTLFKDYRPLRFFSLVALLFFIVGMALGLPVIHEFVATGIVPRFPTAILAAALMFLCALALATGLILDAVAKSDRRQWELESIALFFIPTTARTISRGGHPSSSREVATPRLYSFVSPRKSEKIYALPTFVQIFSYNTIVNANVPQAFQWTGCSRNEYLRIARAFARFRHSNPLRRKAPPQLALSFRGGYTHLSRCNRRHH